ncbi:MULTISPECIES: hypothetical protein [Pseudomonas]|uniref:Uncharacterized protein n=2 Tax=Pseudomonas TaxID=286 RepID=A0ABX6H649_9PSED|nr:MULTISPECIES: hypothetical protein [Pseudomonas]MBC3955818.1 hypothetical protein [Pseudomonas triticifolii]QHF01010.1 hypothetical protein N015_00750 [Pseudomonas asturiensis]
MSDVIIIGISLAAGLLISFGVQPPRWRVGLGTSLIAASLIAIFLLPLAPEGFHYVYVAAWATGLDLVLNRNRYVVAHDGK